MSVALDPLLLTRQQTAATLAISLRSLDHLVASGALRPVRIGKRIQFNRRSIELFAKGDHPNATGQRKTAEAAA